MARKQLFFFLLILAALHVDGATVCNKEGVTGFDEERMRALPIVGANVSSIAAMKLFITVRGEKTIYLQSNFVPQGQVHPTKIAGDAGDANLAWLIDVVMGTDSPSGVPSDDALRAAKDTPIYVDDAFVNSKYGRMDLSGASKFFYLTSVGTHLSSMADDWRALAGFPSLPKPVYHSHEKSWPAFPVDSENGRRWYVEYARHLVAPAGSRRIDALATELEHMTFDRNDVRLLPLTTNTSTLRAIRDQVPALNVIEFDLSSKEKLATLLGAHQGKTILPLGHIENNDFVTYGSNGKETFRIPVAEFKQIAAACCQITVIAFGCNSAHAGGDGVVGKFNTVDAVARFADALGAQTYLGFFQKLAGEGERAITFVVENYAQPYQAISETELRIESTDLADVVSAPTSAPIGRIIIYRPYALPPNVGTQTTQTDTSLTSPSGTDSPQTDFGSTRDESGGDATCLYVLLCLVIVGITVWIIHVKTRGA